MFYCKQLLKLKFVNFNYKIIVNKVSSNNPGLISDPVDKNGISSYKTNHITV